MTYNDAGSLRTQTYPTGEVVTNAYGSDAGWLSSVTSGSTTLLSSAQYTQFGGAYGQITAANLDGTTPIYTYGATFDRLGRATDINVHKVSGNVTLFDQSRLFDFTGSVKSANTTLTAGTDNQAFCYDEQNRLTAAASSGTVPCQTFSPGTLTAAAYNQSFAYDNMGRLTNGPLGVYTYRVGATGPVHGVSEISPDGNTGMTVAYDAAGDATCRNPMSTLSNNCILVPTTGQKLTFDNEGHLSNWQDQQTSPNSTAAYLYDGEGNRVAQQVTSAGSTTTTVYVGNLEEASTTGGVTTTTTYYYANGWRFAMAVGGVFKYLVSDGLGSANVSLDAAGNMIASVLYAPYGSARYNSGTMPTDHGFTGQIADSTSGLDYYGARYYDPVAGQFISADSILPGAGFDIWGLSRYAYVEGNPIIWLDPLGYASAIEAGGGCDKGDPACSGDPSNDSRSGQSEGGTTSGGQTGSEGADRSQSNQLTATTSYMMMSSSPHDKDAPWWLFAKRSDLNNPGGPQLSDEEKAALLKKWSGQRLTPEEQAAATRGEGKLVTGEKYRNERNRRKRQTNFSDALRDFWNWLTTPDPNRKFHGPVL